MYKTLQHYLQKLHTKQGKKKQPQNQRLQKQYYSPKRIRSVMKLADLTPMCHCLFMSHIKL